MLTRKQIAFIKRSCLNKVRYSSYDEAALKIPPNQKIYLCRFGEHYHRATAKGINSTASNAGAGREADARFIKDRKFWRW